MRRRAQRPEDAQPLEASTVRTFAGGVRATDVAGQHGMARPLQRRCSRHRPSASLYCEPFLDQWSAVTDVSAKMSMAVAWGTKFTFLFTA